jgi:hypothetical protein
MDYRTMLAVAIEEAGIGLAEGGIPIGIGTVLVGESQNFPGGVE